MVDRELVKAAFYHGLLPREDMREMLKDNGDWLVRMTEPSQPGRREYVVSMQTDSANNEIRHYVISQGGGRCALRGELTFGSISELFDFYYTKGHPIQKDHVLRNPIVRQKWELKHNALELKKKLGEGAYGEVMSGVLRREGDEGNEGVPVAVKQAKLDKMTKEQIKEVMSEARLMRQFDHLNVVTIYGIAAIEEPVMIVMELASHGALNSYLAKNQVSQEVCIQMTMQAAWGIRYLHTMNCIHRDIAARNCLYGDGQVKISDFGMSRIGESYQMNPNSKAPIRWLAPETLFTAKFSHKTDVWSFGILTWEIFNGAKQPYKGMSTTDVMNFVKSGKRLSLLDSCQNQDFAKTIEDRALQFSVDARWPMSLLVPQLEQLTGLHFSGPLSTLTKPLAAPSPLPDTDPLPCEATPTREQAPPTHAQAPPLPPDNLRSRSRMARRPRQNSSAVAPPTFAGIIPCWEGPIMSPFSFGSSITPFSSTVSTPAKPQSKANRNTTFVNRPGFPR